MQIAGRAVSFSGGSRVSIDLGAEGEIIAVSLRKASRKPYGVEVLRYATAQKSEADSDLSADLARRSGARSEALSLTLARGDYRLLVVPEPSVTPEEMPQTLRWTLASQIDLGPEDADLGWLRIPGSKNDLIRSTQLYVATARKVLVDTLRNAFAKRAGLALRTVDIRETALRNIASLVAAEGESIALIAVTESGASMVFVEGGELLLDRFIEQPLDEWRSADAQARQKICERIALPVMRSVDHIGRSREFKPVGRVVLAPMAEELGLYDYLVEQLPLRVERLDLGKHMDFSRTPELQGPAGQSRALVALGGALRDGPTAQMNLLMRPKVPMGSALWGLGVLGVLLVGLTAFALQLRSDVQGLHTQLGLGTQQLAQVKAEIEAIRQREGSDAEVAALNTEVQDLKPRAAAVKQLVDSLRTASLGRPEGYSDYLDRLARISEPELWVTRVTVLDGGRRVEVAGRAVRNEAVVRYARRLNESFDSLGVKFNAVDIAPDAAANDKSGNPRGLIGFKLS